ncbi:MAG TPA: ATP-binding protein [Anaerolineaceae bacterium]|nr:ATP-binding protein [Anaerolineaceae bacterium]
MNSTFISRYSFPSAWRGRSPGFTEFNILLNLLEEPAVLVDQTRGQLLSANSQLLKLTAFTLAETLNTPFSDLLPSLVRQPLIAGDEREANLTRRNRDSLQVMARIVSLDNNNQWFLICLTPLAIYRQNLADQGRQEQLLRCMSELAGLTNQPDIQSCLTEAMKIGQKLLDVDLLCVYWANSTFPQLQKIAALEQTPEPVFPAILPSQNLHRLQNPTLWLPGKRVSSDLHRTARVANLNFLATVPLGSDGALVGLLVAAETQSAPTYQLMTLMDIFAAQLSSAMDHFILVNNLKSGLEKYRLSLVSQEALVENTSEGVILVDPQLTILDMNPTAELLLGYPNSEVQGNNIENIMIGSDALSAALQNAQQNIPTHDLGNINLHRRTGQTFFALIRTIPILDGDTVIGIAVLFKDVSENEQIRLRTQQLEQRALLGNITAIFAHEVRNPINNISTGLQLISMKLPEDDPNQEYLTRMLHDCTRLTHLMESVLSFSRPKEYKFFPTDVCELLKRLLDRWNPRLARVNVKPYFHPEPNCPLVNAEPYALEQVFTNLISNAVQAMSETGGTLSVKVTTDNQSPDNPQLEISVSDTGPGIPDEIRARIFEPFVTTNPQGTGLGLAITKSILTAHKGSINVTSFPGGTIFHVSLPAYNGDSEQ